MEIEELRLKIKHKLVGLVEKTFSRNDQSKWLTDKLDREFYYKDADKKIDYILCHYFDFNGSMYPSDEYYIFINKHETNKETFKLYYDDIEKKFNARYNDSHKSVFLIPVDGGMFGFVRWLRCFNEQIDVIKHTPPMEMWAGLVDEINKEIADNEE